MNGGIFSKEVLRLDPEREVERICARVKELMLTQVKRRGLVVALSGGIDSSVTAALAVRAIGKERVIGLEMPERHSSGESQKLSGKLAAALGIETVLEEISAALEAVGCYRKYDEAVRMVVPGYGEGWKSKIVISNNMEHPGFTSFYLVAQDGAQGTTRVRLPFKPYLQIVAATNFKQRIRKMLEYYHADRLNFAVAGTPNRLEYDQGFFVKLGDGAADIKPIAHLYKSQVYQLAEYLGVPEEIRRRTPTTDTYSLAQGQDEFYFSLPYPEMDLCLFAKNNGVAPESVAAALGLTPEQVRLVFQDIEVKRSSTRYLHLPPLLVEAVDWQ
ncbi:NAD+ synthetase [Citrifermentans bemidjiense Bem]|uniref:NH(3)-dependent NAD(+) synthetase n=1 Tax=Citrifermentans bemidjiense (strain ATCC BAA-1014 / DSM 16622 / JCM 12645 / Bem) TaxID=404380 RepID=B5EH01_CITBB|nr:NAD(+) synthase [Citrifermentans bemidjiense]ACH38103.1 NAD+ synthetase [Citrifermentans bemidjiense Bem]